MAPHRAWIPPTLISLALVAASLMMQYALFEEFPLFPYFDEVYTVPASRAIATAPETMATDHPPFVPYLMSLSESVLGDNPTGWRLPSRICGALTLPAVFLIGFLLTGTLIGPTLGALALLCDGLFITLSRAALWDTPYVCFGMYAVLVSLWDTRRASNPLTTSYLIASGMLMGLSLSSKWSGVFFLAPIALVHLSSGNSMRLARKCRDVAILSLVSLAIYILVTCALRHMSIQELFAQTVEMLQRHVNFTQPHRYASSAWGWPVLTRPIWFGYTKLPFLAIDGSQAVRGTICLGNPAVFILTGLSVVWLVGLSLRDGLHRRARLVTTLPLVGYLACWVPWVLLISRKGFLYYFYPSLVFACIGFGIACSAILVQRGKGFLWCALAVMFILTGLVTYLPLYVGAPTSLTYMENVLPWKTWW